MGEAKAATKRKPRKIDRSDSYVRAILIVGFYSAAMVIASTYSGLENLGGTTYSKSPFYKFMLSDPVIFGLPLLYAMSVFLLSRYMVDKEPLDKFIKAYIQPPYNVLQIVVCAWMVWGMIGQLSLDNPFGINTLRDPNVEFFVFVHYLTKYLDWTDTFVMILKKSYGQVSFLQVYHHATIGMVWGFVLSRGWGSATATYGAFINSVTHVIMYTHYLWTSFGLKNPFKKYITKFQLAQFLSCFVHAVLVLCVETIYPLSLAILQFCYHPTMMYLFGFRLNWVPKWITGEVPDLDKKAD
jgi:elongation of very long chain fatty acids protein 4